MRTALMLYSVIVMCSGFSIASVSASNHSEIFLPGAATLPHSRPNHITGTASAAQRAAPGILFLSGLIDAYHW